MKNPMIVLFALVLLAFGYVVSDAIPSFFDPYEEYPYLESGSSSSSIVVFPFIGADLLADIAVADIENNSLEIWMHAPPNFYNIQTIDLDYSPRFIISADFNGDGKPALVTSSTTGDNISVFIQEDEYTFVHHANYDSGIGPWDMATADFTGDNLPDLVVANPWDTHLTFFSSPLPDNDFNQIEYFECVFGINYLLPGDFDNDEVLELVALDTNDGRLIYMENDGSGNLSMVASYQIASPDVELRDGVVVELNGDDLPDLILSVNRLDDSESDFISILINNGFGQFEQTAIYNTHELPVVAIAEDFTGDDIIDLVVSCYADGGFDTFIGEADGSFLHHSFIEAGPGARDVAGLHLAGDDDLDLAVAAREEGRVYLFENHFDQLTASPGTPAEPAPGTLAVVPNPFNPRTKIRYQMASAGNLQLTVFDSRGRRVRVLHSGSAPAGSGFVVWDGTSDSGRPLASGVYSVRMQAGTIETTTKAMLLK